LHKRHFIHLLNILECLLTLHIRSSRLLQTIHEVYKTDPKWANIWDNRSRSGILFQSKEGQTVQIH